MVYWHWLALGAALAVVEIVAPGVFFLWLGLAAIVTGLLLWVIPGTPWTAQLLVFAVVAIVSIYVSRRFVWRGEPESDRPDLNRRGQRYVGQVFTLSEPTLDGRGRIKVGDGWWRVTTTSGDLPAGARVRVVGIDGTTLRIQAAD